jgi:hypothetical protein
VDGDPSRSARSQLSRTAVSRSLRRLLALLSINQRNPDIYFNHTGTIIPLAQSRVMRSLLVLTFAGLGFIGNGSIAAAQDSCDKQFVV